MHATPSGHRLALSAFLAFIMLLCGAPSPVSAAPAAAGVRPGIEVFLDDVPAALRGKRVGLITNNTGIDRSGTSDIDLIAQSDDLTLVALLAPEHGIRGTLEAGVTVGDGVDAKTGVPVYSLYAAQGNSPTPEMLKNVDVLVYDLQEVGGRTWTYVSTMALSMQAAARKGIPFVVLDRPNPIGGDIVEGALLDPAFASFIGMYPIPARHGMTVGELATLFNQQQGIGADLTVVPAQGWRRGQWFDQTGLPWVNPSPNLRSLAAVTSYPGTVYFEGTNLSEGRGTDLAGALDYLNLVVSRRSVVFMISDFLAPDFTKALTVSSKRHDLVAMPVIDKGESELPNVGIITLEDAETGEQIDVNTSSKAVRRALREINDDRLADLEYLLRSRRVDIVRLTTTEDYLISLRNFFEQRERRQAA
jgi:hypothetical protein